MKYLVMECHESYAVVLDEQGRFIKAANLGYKVGDRVEKILPMQEKRENKLLKFALPVAAAACICFLVAVWSYLFMPFGTVMIEINPQVLVTSNRVDRVIKLEGVNEDGKELIEGYKYKGKDFRIVTEELTEIAETKGYLASGGDVNITVESDHMDWKLHAEEVLVGNLHIHEGKGFHFIVDGIVLRDHIADAVMDEIDDELDDILDDVFEAEEDEDDDDEDDRPSSQSGKSSGKLSRDDDEDDHDDDEDDEDEDDDRDEDDDDDD